MVGAQTVTFLVRELHPELDKGDNSKLADILKGRDVALRVSEAARNQIAAEGYDPVFGARPVQRVIQQSIQNPLATEVLRGDFPEGSTVEIDYRDGEFTFEKSAEREPQEVASN